MKRLLIAFSVVVALAACSSAPKNEQDAVKVEDRKPAPSQPTQPSRADTSPVTPQTTTGNPLRDPNNILSKRSIFFDYDQYVVKDEFKPLVGAHAKYLSQTAAQRVTIQGNTDERGSREYNLALGQKRADAVKQMMVLSGAPAQNIETVSFGEEKPRNTGHDEQSYAENRRADVVYSGE
jgi:peptidoglycan-associated lipoprotein